MCSKINPEGICDFCFLAWKRLGIQGYIQSFRQAQLFLSEKFDYDPLLPQTNYSVFMKELQSPTHLGPCWGSLFISCPGLKTPKSRVESSSRWTHRHAIFQARPLALTEPFPGRPSGRRGSGEAGAASQPVHCSPEKRRRHQGLSQSCSRTHVPSEPSSFISGSPYLTPLAMPCPGFSTEASLWRRRRKKLENSSLQYVCIPSSLSSPFPWPQSLLFEESLTPQESKGKGGRGESFLPF